MLTQQDNTTTETKNRKDNNMSTQQDTVGHNRTQQDTVGHSRTQQDTVGHSRTQQDTLNKTPMSAEEKLLRAIFGDDDNSEVKDTDSKDAENKEPRTAPNFCIKRMADILALIDPLAKRLLVKDILLSGENIPAANKAFIESTDAIIKKRADQLGKNRDLFLAALDELKDMYTPANDRPDGVHIARLESGKFTYTPVISWSHEMDDEIERKYVMDFAPCNLAYDSKEEAEEEAKKFVSARPEFTFHSVDKDPTYILYTLVNNSDNTPATGAITDDYCTALAYQVIMERRFAVLDFLAEYRAVDKKWIERRRAVRKAHPDKNGSHYSSSLITGVFPVPDEIYEKAERVLEHLYEHVDSNKETIYGLENNWLSDFEMLNAESDMVLTTGKWIDPVKDAVVAENHNADFYIPLTAIWRDMGEKKDYRFLAVLACKKVDDYHFTVIDAFTDLWQLIRLNVKGAYKCALTALTDPDSDGKLLFMNEADLCVYGQLPTA